MMVNFVLTVLSSFKILNPKPILMVRAPKQIPPKDVAFIAATSLGGICLGALTISMGFGFRILKEDKTVRTKLTIIFTFIALLLAILAIVLATVLLV